MIIVKIGGGENINVKGIIADLENINDSFIIVHGANAIRNKLAGDLRNPIKTITSVSGYSSVFSDKNLINLMMMAYSGVRNKRIVEMCHQHNINAVGLSGIDGKAIQGERNKGIKVNENGKLRILRDFSGKPRKINTGLLRLLLDNGYVPVLCVPIIDENNFAINSENDDIINLLEQEFHAEKIIQLIEAPGFLEDKDNPDSLVRKIPSNELIIREKKVNGRMKRKILALRKLFENGAGMVMISDGRTEHPVKDALNNKGTIIS